MHSMLLGRIDPQREGGVFRQIAGQRLGWPLRGRCQGKLIGLPVLAVQDQPTYLRQDARYLRRLHRFALPGRDQSLVVEDDLLGKRVPVDFDIHFGVSADEAVLRPHSLWLVAYVLICEQDGEPRVLAAWAADRKCRVDVAISLTRRTI